VIGMQSFGYLQYDCCGAGQCDSNGVQWGGRNRIVFCPTDYGTQPGVTKYLVVTHSLPYTTAGPGVRSFPKIPEHTIQLMYLVY
jgi:hypothetical protein